MTFPFTTFLPVSTCSTRTCPHGHRWKLKCRGQSSGKMLLAKLYLWFIYFLDHMHWCEKIRLSKINNNVSEWHWNLETDFRSNARACLPAIKVLPSVKVMILDDVSAWGRIFQGETFKRSCTKTLFLREMVKRPSEIGFPILHSRVIFIGIICRLFSSVTTGYSDWKHASRDINHHEISPLHQSCTAKLVARRTKGERVEKALIEQHESEKKYWRQLLECILSVIKFHSSRGLAFRGSNEIIGSVLAKYDTFLAEHIQRRV